MIKWVAAIAPWFCLRLPSCSPGFESQAHHLCFFNYWNCNEKRTKINKKRPGLAHLKKQRSNRELELLLVENKSQYPTWLTRNIVGHGNLCTLPPRSKKQSVGPIRIDVLLKPKVVSVTITRQLLTPSIFTFATSYLHSKGFFEEKMSIFETISTSSSAAKKSQT